MTEMLSETSWRRVWIPLMSPKARILSTLSPGRSATNMSMLKTLFRLEKPSCNDSNRFVPQDSTKRSRWRSLPWRKARSSEERIQWNSVTQDWYLQGWRHWWVLERLTSMTWWRTSWQQFSLPYSVRKVVSSGFQSQSPSSSEDSRWKLPIPQEVPDTRCGYWWMCHTLGDSMAQQRNHQGCLVELRQACHQQDALLQTDTCNIWSV